MRVYMFSYSYTYKKHTQVCMHMFTYMYVCIYIHILGMQHFLCSMIVVPMSYFINSIELAEETRRRLPPQRQQVGHLSAGPRNPVRRYFFTGGLECRVKGLGRLSTNPGR